jgi:raffinose/stachyose/melibiose transport system substrate-binding protein
MAGIACMVLAGCSKKTDDKVTLDVSHFMTYETRNESTEINAYHIMKDKFLAAHPDVSLNETILEQTDYQTKVMALAASDEMPDIFFTKGSWVDNFYDNNLMLDLTGKIDLSQFREGAFTSVTRNGKVFGIPTQLSYTSIVYYNAQMFADIGYDHFPATWAELVDADAKFKAKSITTIAIGNKDRWPFESCVFSAMGDRFTGMEWTQSIIQKDGKAKFTDPEFVEALKYAQQMAGMFNKNFNEITNSQGDMLYCNGKAAVNIEGMWNIPYLIANADSTVLANTHLAILPSFPGQKGDVNATSGGSGWVQSINANLTGAKLDAAVEYVKQTVGREYNQFLIDDSGQLGPIEVTPKDRNALPAIAQEYLDLSAKVTLVPIYDIQMDGSVIDVMNSKLQALLAGQETPEAVAQAIQAVQERASAK